MRYFRSLLFTLLWTAAILHAHELDNRHGVIPDNKEGFVFEGGVTVTGQFSNAKRINNEILASFDLFGNAPLGDGQLSIYLEGNLSPSGRGIASQLGITNADAGSALDRNDNGRLQLSELHYLWPINNGEVYLGLIDPTRFLDASDIANDETQQFIGAGFVNNPLIGFPDYTLGIAYHYVASDNQPGFAAMLSSSHGIADNPNRSYRQLIQLFDQDKGLFAGAELYYPWRNIKIRTGLWINSASKQHIDEPQSKAKSYGVYTSIDAEAGHHQWNLRYGYTNPDVTTSNHFAAIAYQYQYKQATLGLGLAHQRITHKTKDNTNSPNTQAELYLRINPVPGLSITPSIQYLHGKSTSQNDQQLSKNNWVAGLRLSYYF